VVIFLWKYEFNFNDLSAEWHGAHGRLSQKKQALHRWKHIGIHRNAWLIMPALMVYSNWMSREKFPGCNMNLIENYLCVLALIFVGCSNSRNKTRQSESKLECVFLQACFLPGRISFRPISTSPRLNTWLPQPLLPGAIISFSLPSHPYPSLVIDIYSSSTSFNPIWFWKCCILRF